MMMAKALFKHPLFLGGFLFIFLLVMASVVHSVFFGGVTPQMHYVYNQQGVLIQAPPISPIHAPPLGTDAMGNEIFFKLLLGAKYTIGIAVIVGFLRVVISLIFGMLYGHFFIRFSRYAAGLVNSFYYLPISLLCYLILKTVLMSHGVPPKFTLGYEQRMIFEFMILTIIALPTTSLLIGNQIHQILKEEFIIGVKTLGGSRFHILRKHVLPHLWPRLLVQFFEQVVQALILLVHLGFFRLLFGGTKAFSKPGGEPVFISVSGEWSGMIGNHYDYLFTNYIWIPLAPLVAFAVVILAFNFMEKGTEDVLVKRGYPRQSGKKKNLTKNDPFAGPDDVSFEPVRDRAL